MKRLLLALGGLCILLLASCGSTAPHQADTSPTTGPLPAPTTASTVPATSTTTVPNTSVIPKKITVAYVNAVFAKLDQVYGDAVRSVVAADKLTTQASIDLSSIYTRRLYGSELADFAAQLSEGLTNVRHPPGNELTSVADLVSASPTCIFARVDISYAAVIRNPVKNPRWIWEGLKPLHTPNYLNPTHWVEFYELELLPKYHVPDECRS